MSFGIAVMTAVLLFVIVGSALLVGGVAILRHHRLVRTKVQAENVLVHSYSEGTAA